MCFNGALVFEGAGKSTKPKRQRSLVSEEEENWENRPVILNLGCLCPQGTFSNVRRHFLMDTTGKGMLVTSSG